MKNKIFILALVILCLTIALCGCDSGVAFLSGSDEKKVEYTTSNVIYFPMEKVRTLNPAISKDEDTYYISKLIYDGLFELDSNLMAQKKLVDSYSYGNDNDSIVLELKRGVLWHDGKELTAADVKFSIDTYINLSYSNETLYSNYVANIKSVSTSKGNQYQVTIAFKNDNIAIENLVFPIIQANQFKKSGDIKKATEQYIPIGTGPYQVEEYNNLSHLVLKANSRYFGIVPNNSLKFVILPEKESALNLIDVSNISILYNKDMDRDTLLTNMNVQTVDFVSNEVEFVGFNFQNDVLKNKKVRQAIASAIDTQTILENAYLKSGVLNDSIYYPGYLGIENKNDAFELNLDKAISLLNASGYKDLDGDGYIDDKDGKGISISILVNSNDNARVSAAQLIKNTLDKLPIESYIIYCGLEEYRSKITTGDYDIYIGGYTFRENYDLRDALHSAYGNPARYSNEVLDKLLDEMQSGVSNNKKAEIFKEVHSILTDEIPYYCLLYKTYGAIASPALQGEINPMFDNLYKGCENWVCKYEIPIVVTD